MPKTFYYTSTGPDLTLYDVDVAGAALARRDTVTLPQNIQYAWQHPSRPVLYVASSNGGPSGLVGDTHCVNALAIDPASGALRPIGTTVMLPARPIHNSVDRSGEYLLTAYNVPSSVTVHRLNADGTIGAGVAQPKLNTGIYAHQILTAPTNTTALLVTRGNDEKPGKPEDPGAIKTFAFANGALSDLASIAPGTGLGFGPRHLDFHPTRPWVFVSIERQINSTFMSATTPPVSPASRYSSKTVWRIRSRRYGRPQARSTSIRTERSSTRPIAPRI